MNRSVKQLVKSIFLPSGLKPTRIRRGPAAGITLELDLHKDTQCWLGRYETQVMKWTIEHVPIGGVCVDVVAAGGLFTLLMARKAGPTGRVVAFEPNTDSLKRAIKLNAATSLSPIDIHTGFAGAGNSAQAMSVDQKLAELQIQKVDFLKIDVDGGEVDVLTGLAETLRRHHPPMALELHSTELRDQCVAILDKAGYQTRIVKPPVHESRPLEYNQPLYGIWRS